MLAIKLVSLLLLALAIHTDGLKLQKDVPVFVKTLKDLQRGPPKQMLTNRAEVTEEWIEQPLDHFDDKNKETYKMRYLVNNEFQTEGSPIFIFLGGEWEAEPGMLTKSHWYDMAKQHKGVLIYTEHRYYGASVPTPTMSTENLKYLSVKQALADVANFINTYKAENAQLAKSKVLLAGGSYSATMVVWFMREYPDLIVGGWASSAPLLAKVDFYDYKVVVGKAIRELGGQQCYNRIENGIAELENMFKNQRSAEARAMLRLCSSFDHTNDLDFWSLFGAISNIFSGIVQRQRPGDVEYWCDFLLKFEDDATAIANLFYHAAGYPTCVDMRYSETVAYYQELVADFDDSLPWYYQTCNEFGWYQSSRAAAQPFGKSFPATLYIELCQDIFGAKYRQSQIESYAAETNEHFGGMEPAVENVFMTHGSLDPWNAVGHGVAEGATVIAQASHCNDLAPMSSADSAEMRAAKEKIAELVTQWLA
ncbi:CG18493 [Drosophila busckii]|uniref:CG18493 n=1 Tax=Drosophila busckii TaxID=30019 RepID=A0A0M5J040_DROBS|nr:thymus-specific serine protease [Drosophila busckii]ALC46986.1 CG18493 [Drosophila busckii]